MWIQKKKWEQMRRQINACEKRIAIQEKIIDLKIFEMAKKILRQPDELSKEIESREAIDRLIDGFIQS